MLNVVPSSKWTHFLSSQTYICLVWSSFSRELESVAKGNVECSMILLFDSDLCKLLFKYIDSVLPISEFFSSSNLRNSAYNKSNLNKLRSYEYMVYGVWIMAYILGRLYLNINCCFIGSIYGIWNIICIVRYHVEMVHFN